MTTQKGCPLQRGKETKRLTNVKSLHWVELLLQSRAFPDGHRVGLSWKLLSHLQHVAPETEDWTSTQKSPGKNLLKIFLPEVTEVDRQNDKYKYLDKVARIEQTGIVYFRGFRWSHHVNFKSGATIFVLISNLVQPFFSWQMYSGSTN